MGWQRDQQQWSHKRCAHVIDGEPNARRLSKVRVHGMAQVIAMDVVNPDDISVGFEDIGGMFDVKQALVRTASSSSRSWEHDGKGITERRD